jgi:hypothetical protein
MAMRTLFLLILVSSMSCLAMILQSCEKDENPQFNQAKCESSCFIVQGRIIEGQTSNPLSNVHVSASRRYNQFVTDLLVTTSTNDNGEFEVSIPESYFRENDISPGFYIRIDKDGYLNNPHRELFLFDSSEVDEPRMSESILYHASTVKVHLHNNPNTDFGSVSIGVDWDLEDIGSFGHVMHDSPTFEAEIIYSVPSETDVTLDWYTYGGQVDVAGEREFVVPRDSILEFDIHL